MGSINKKHFQGNGAISTKGEFTMKKIPLSVLCLLLFTGLSVILATFPVHIKAQTALNKNPKSDPNDDENLCKVSEKPLENDKFCSYYRDYVRNVDDNPAAAAEYRNRMIDLLKVQIDEYYNEHKNGRVKKTKWFQTVLDILGVGLAFTGNIVGGSRSKTVLAATAGAFQAGRNSVNDRFELLQQQILINKMNANRLEQWARIVGLKNSTVSEFSWDNAKGELQQYLFRGSFIDALDSLVQQTGAQVQVQQTNLNNVLKAVTQTALAAKLKNFTGYIRPLNERAIKLDADIAAIALEIASNIALLGVPAPAPLPAAILAKQVKKTELQTKKDNLMENYKNIWLAIQVGGDFDVIDQKIRTKFAAALPVITRYDAFLTNFKNTPAVLTADDYDFVLTKVNAVIGDDDELDKRFLDILNTNKLP